MYCIITVSQYISMLMLQQFTIITVQYIILKIEKKRSNVSHLRKDGLFRSGYDKSQHHNFGFGVNPE